MKIPKMIVAGYASKLKTLRSGNWKLNEFDISVNLYMHLYRPNENKWPKEDGSGKFVDGFERIDERVEIEFSIHFGIKTNLVCLSRDKLLLLTDFNPSS